jgi:hypothetical protein
MNKTDKEIIKKYLNKIIEGDLSYVHFKLFGLCSYLHDYTRDTCAYGFVSNNSVGWEHHTGNEQYPVPHIKSLGLWKGENLEMRQDLCKYLLTKLESM